jgi:hypothetical protein
MTIHDAFAAVLVSLTLGGPGQTHPTHGQDRAQHAMGFDQQRTEHHFLIEPQGGTIKVTAKDPQDRESEVQIRTHLQHIARAFADGDFSLPFFVHDTEPPGIAVMKARRSTLAYRFESLRGGGRVVVRTTDAQALSAFHEFLRFQIREHKTGDPLEPIGRKRLQLSHVTAARSQIRASEAGSPRGEALGQ